MEIRKANNGVMFYYGTRTITENTKQIKSIMVKRDSATLKYVLIIYGTCRKYLRVDYDKVTSPVTADAEELRDIILLWNNDQLQTSTFIASAGQTAFTTSFALQSNVNVYIGGVLQSATDFTFTVGEHTVTWIGSALVGNEEIVIETF